MGRRTTCVPKGKVAFPDSFPFLSHSPRSECRACRERGASLDVVVVLRYMHRAGAFVVGVGRVDPGHEIRAARARAGRPADRRRTNVAVVFGKEEMARAREHVGEERASATRALLLEHRAAFEAYVVERGCVWDAQDLVNRHRNDADKFAFKPAVDPFFPQQLDSILVRGRAYTQAGRWVGPPSPENCDRLTRKLRSPHPKTAIASPKNCDRLTRKLRSPHTQRPLRRHTEALPANAATSGALAFPPLAHQGRPKIQPSTRRRAAREPEPEQEREPEREPEPAEAPTEPGPGSGPGARSRSAPRAAEPSGPRRQRGRAPAVDDAGSEEESGARRWGGWTGQMGELVAMPEVHDPAGAVYGTEDEDDEYSEDWDRGYGDSYGSESTSLDMERDSEDDDDL